MKRRVLYISVLIAVCLIAFAFILSGASKPAGGDGTGMFEFPAVSKITISTQAGKLVDITDPKTIRKIQELCKEKDAFVELGENQKNKRACDIWVDFNNSRTVVGLCSDGAYGNLENKKATNVDLKIGSDLFDYIGDLLGQ